MTIGTSVFYTVSNPKLALGIILDRNVCRTEYKGINRTGAQGELVIVGARGRQPLPWQMAKPSLLNPARQMRAEWWYGSKPVAIHWPGSQGESANVLCIRKRMPGWRRDFQLWRLLVHSAIDPAAGPEQRRV